MTTDPYYESRFKYDASRETIWREIVRYESKFIANDSTVLDLGAGYCTFINNVQAARKYALDISPELPRHAGKGVNTLQQGPWDIHALANNSVDVIHASNFFEHFDDAELEKIMREVKRLLKPGGTLILMQPNYRLAVKQYFDDYTHKKIFTDISLQGFLESQDMRVIFKRPRFLPYSMRSKPSLLPPGLLSVVVRAYLHSPWKPFAGQMLFVAQKS